MIEYYLIGLAVLDILILGALWRIIASLPAKTRPKQTHRRSYDKGSSDKELDNRW